MKDDLYTEKLDWFKQNEKPEVVLLVVDNPDRVRIILAWTNMSVKYAESLTALRSKDENEVWDWLWENTRYSKKELIGKAGVPLSELSLENKMKPLIGNRILYPDGTVNSFVQRYLREQVVKLFEMKTNRSLKRS